MGELRPSVLGGLAPLAAVLVVAMLLGSAAPASAQNPGVLDACVHVDRHGNFHGELRIVGANQRCARSEAHVILPLAGTGGIPGPTGPQGPAGPPGPQGPPGESYEGGGIRGVLTQCGTPMAGSRAYLNGHSFVVFIEADASQNVTGAFEMHNVPPGTYDLFLFGPNYSQIVEDVPVTAGQINDLGTVNVCFID